MERSLYFFLASSINGRRRSPSLTTGLSSHPSQVNVFMLSVWMMKQSCYYAEFDG